MQPYIPAGSLNRAPACRGESGNVRWQLTLLCDPIMAYVSLSRSGEELLQTVTLRLLSYLYQVERLQTQLSVAMERAADAEQRLDEQRGLAATKNLDDHDDDEVNQSVILV